MRRTTKLVLWILVLALAGYGGLRTYLTVQARRVQASGGTDMGEAPRVTVRRVTTDTLVDSVSLTGDIEALTSVDVVPEVSGRLERLRLPDGTLLDEGVPVRAGEVIAVIEHAALAAAVQSAQAALVRARVQAKPEVIAATIHEAEAAVAAVKAQQGELAANLRNLERDKDRKIRLCEQGSCTEQMRDNAVTAYEAASEQQKALEAQLKRAEAGLALAQAQTAELAAAGVALAEAAVKQAQVMLDQATIEAPVSGVIGKKWCEEGDMVGPGKVLARIVQIDTVKGVGGIGERHLSALAVGTTAVQVTVDAYPGEKFDGVVHLIGAEVDRATRTVKVEGRIVNADHRLKPGMFARIKVIVGRKPNVVVVPDMALMREGSRVWVYVVEAGRARRRALRLGFTEGVRHEVLEGLSAGDRVMVRGQRTVRDGSEVVVEEGSP